MFDAEEEEDVHDISDSRSILALVPLVASAAFVLLIFFLWSDVGVYVPSEDGYVMFLQVLQVVALGFIWISVGLARAIDRHIFVVAILAAILLTILWWLGYFYGKPQYGV